MSLFVLKATISQNQNITNIEINNNIIKIHNQEKYLGFIIENEGHMYNFEKLITEMKIRTNLEDDNSKLLETTWHKLTLNLHSMTNNNSIPLLMETPDIRSIIDKRMINFTSNGLQHSNPLVSDIFLNSLTDIKSSYFCKNVNIILKKYKLAYLDLFYKKINKNKRK